MRQIILHRIHIEGSLKLLRRQNTNLDQDVAQTGTPEIERKGFFEGVVHKIFSCLTSHSIRRINCAGSKGLMNTSPVPKASIGASSLSVSGVETRITYGLFNPYFWMSCSMWKSISAHRSNSHTNSWGFWEWIKSRPF